MRFSEIDLARGIGISLVVIYHIFFDLTYFGAGNWLANPAVWFLGRLAAITMILVAGISLSISRARWRGKKGAAAHHAKRVILLCTVATLITLGTWIYPHEGFIFFGIIHFIAAASLIGFIIGHSRAAVVILALLSLPIWFLLQTQIASNVFLAVLGEQNGIYTLDLFTIFPWIGVFCAGMLAGDLAYGANKRRFDFAIPSNTMLQWMGRNSLAIYLLHQPILVGAWSLAMKIGLARIIGA